MSEHRMIRVVNDGVPLYGCQCGHLLPPGSAGVPPYTAALRAFRLHASEAEASEVEKRRGMALALTAHDAWKDRFRETVETLAITGAPFTSEDVLDVVGLPSGTVATNGNNAVGAMMNGMAARGIIEKTSMRWKSRRRTSHARELAVWVGK